MLGRGKAKQELKLAHSSTAYLNPTWSGDYAFRSIAILSHQNREIDGDWYADSGASQHMSDQNGLLSTTSQSDQVVGQSRV